MSKRKSRKGNSSELPTSQCRLCAKEISISNLISINEVVEVDNKYTSSNELNHLKNLVLYCVDLDLSKDSPSAPRAVCRDCVEQLNLIYSFKVFCKRNSEDVFNCYPPTEEINEPVSTKNLSLNEPSTSKTPEIAFINIKTENLDKEVIQEEVEEAFDDESLLEEVEVDEKPKSKGKRGRPALLLDPDSKRKRVAEQARRRRKHMRLNNPEEYKKILIEEAARKRELRQLKIESEKAEDRERHELRRSKMTEEEKAAARAREAERKRIRRARMTPEEKARAAERKRFQTAIKTPEERAKEAERKRFLRAQRTPEEKARDAERKRNRRAEERTVKSEFSDSSSAFDNGIFFVEV